MIDRAFGLSFVRKNPCVLFVAVAYLYIFLVLLNYENAWMHPEEFGIKTFIAAGEPGLVLEDLRMGLNYQIFEYRERTYRPLSSYFQIVDTKFRAWLWHYFLPHPSVSLTFLFSLILSPLLLFKLFRRLKLDTNISLGGAALYLVSPGLLCTVAMLSRPAKAMTNFSLILFLYLACRLNDQRTEKGSVPFRSFLLFTLFMFLTFFWDETALLIYPTVILFFPRLMANIKRAAVLLALPLLTFVTVAYLIPYATVKAGHPWPKLAEFTPVRDFFSLGDFFVRDLIRNTVILFQESLALMPPTLMPSLPAKTLAAFNFIAVVFMAAQTIRSLISAARKKEMRPKIIRWCVHAGYLLGLCIFTTYLLDKAGPKLGIWGIYWYGIYFSIFFTIFLVLSADLMGASRWSTFTALSVIFLNLIYVFPYTNYAYKKFHYYYPHEATQFRKIVTHEINRFTLPRDSPSGLFSSTRHYWQARQNRDPGIVYIRIPKELVYLPIELRSGRGRPYPREPRSLKDAWVTAHLY